VQFFNPRPDHCADHFVLHGALIHPLTTGNGAEAQVSSMPEKQ